jgi:hypothetical protein
MCYCCEERTKDQCVLCESFICKKHINPIYAWLPMCYKEAGIMCTNSRKNREDQKECDFCSKPSIGRCKCYIFICDDHGIKENNVYRCKGPHQVHVIYDKSKSLLINIFDTIIIKP